MDKPQKNLFHALIGDQISSQSPTKLRIKIGDEEVMSAKIDISNFTLHKTNHSECDDITYRSQSSSVSVSVGLENNHQCALCSVPINSTRMRLNEFIFIPLKFSQQTPNCFNKPYSTTNFSFQAKRSKRCDSSFNVESVFSKTVGLYHCSVDVNRLQNGRLDQNSRAFIGTDGQKCLPGIANAYVDAEYKPFGLIVDLNLVGFPYLEETSYDLFMTTMTLDLANNPNVICSDVPADTVGVLVHRLCYQWAKFPSEVIPSNPIMFLDTIKHNLENVCDFCLKLGASIHCDVQNCTRVFHLPCLAPSGCLMDLKTEICWCPDHLGRCNSKACTCGVCDKSIDREQMLMCWTCGVHYHSSCFEMVDINPTVRVAWQCPDCKTCMICGDLGDDEKEMVLCDICEQGCHIGCFDPPIQQIPGNGWRCETCRVCNDCGIRSYEADSLLWYNNYTLCSGCFVLRKKVNNCCVICHRACQMKSKKPLQSIKCILCKKSVHNVCDPSTSAPEDFVCLNCSSLKSGDTRLSNVERSTKNLLAEKVVDCSSTPSSCATTPLPNSTHESNFHPPATKPHSKTKPSERKRLNQKISRSTGKGSKKRNFTSRRCRVKARKVNNPDRFSPSTFVSSAKKNVIKTDNKTDDKDDHPSTVIIYEVVNDFLNKQDICYSCGSLGKEDPLLTCSQCGQAYHTFCAEVTRITKTMFNKGWRCLDCTVCEGCGQSTDESRLLLCEDCDISFHTLCLDPPLQDVPRGAWRCSNCVSCKECGSKSPGINCSWQSNYTLCGPCQSQIRCPVCTLEYRDSDLLISCTHCSRWCHGHCDRLNTEDEVDFVISHMRLSSLTHMETEALFDVFGKEACDELIGKKSTGYVCPLCRKTSNLCMILSQKYLMQCKSRGKSVYQALNDCGFSSGNPDQTLTPQKTKDQSVSCLQNEASHLNSLNYERCFYWNGIVVTEEGFRYLKDNLPKMQPRRLKKRSILYDGIISSESCSLAPPTLKNIPNDEDSSHYEGEFESLRSPSVHSDDGSDRNSTKLSLTVAKAQSNIRPKRPINHGIGGFRARQNRVNQLKKHNGSICDAENVTNNKRRNKKKSVFEESYPDYLMHSFWGSEMFNKMNRMDVEVNAVSDIVSCDDVEDNSLSSADFNKQWDDKMTGVDNRLIAAMKNYGSLCPEPSADGVVKKKEFTSPIGDSISDNSFVGHDHPKGSQGTVIIPDEEHLREISASDFDDLFNDMSDLPISNVKKAQDSLSSLPILTLNDIESHLNDNASDLHSLRSIAPESEINNIVVQQSHSEQSGKQPSVLLRNESAFGNVDEFAAMTQRLPFPYSQDVNQQYGSLSLNQKLYCSYDRMQRVDSNSERIIPPTVEQQSQMVMLMTPTMSSNLAPTPQTTGTTLIKDSTKGLHPPPPPGLSDSPKKEFNRSSEDYFSIDINQSCSSTPPPPPYPILEDQNHIRHENTRAEFPCNGGCPEELDPRYSTMIGHTNAPKIPAVSNTVQGKLVIRADLPEQGILSPTSCLSGTTESSRNSNVVSTPDGLSFALNQTPVKSAYSVSDSMGKSDSNDQKIPSPFTKGAAGVITKRFNYSKWLDEEPLGNRCAVGPLLYANCKHPDLKIQHPDSSERYQIILKLWRKSPKEDRDGWVAKSKENRTLRASEKSGVNKKFSNKKKRSNISEPAPYPSAICTEQTADMTQVISHSNCEVSCASAMDLPTDNPSIPPKDTNVITSSNAFFKYPAFHGGINAGVPLSYAIVTSQKPSLQQSTSLPKSVPANHFDVTSNIVPDKSPMQTESTSNLAVTQASKPISISTAGSCFIKSPTNTDFSMKSDVMSPERLTNLSSHIISPVQQPFVGSGSIPVVSNFATSPSSFSFEPPVIVTKVTMDKKPWPQTPSATQEGSLTKLSHSSAASKLNDVHQNTSNLPFTSTADNRPHNISSGSTVILSHLDDIITGVVQCAVEYADKPAEISNLGSEHNVPATIKLLSNDARLEFPHASGAKVGHNTVVPISVSTENERVPLLSPGLSLPNDNIISQKDPGRICSPSWKDMKKISPADNTTSGRQNSCFLQSPSNNSTSHSAPSQTIQNPLSSSEANQQLNPLRSDRLTPSSNPPGAYHGAYHPFPSGYQPCRSVAPDAKGTLSHQLTERPSSCMSTVPTSSSGTVSGNQIFMIHQPSNVFPSTLNQSPMYSMSYRNVALPGYLSANNVTGNAQHPFYLPQNNQGNRLGQLQPRAYQPRSMQASMESHTYRSRQAQDSSHVPRPYRDK